MTSRAPQHLVRCSSTPLWLVVPQYARLPCPYWSESAFARAWAARASLLTSASTGLPALRSMLLCWLDSSASLPSSLVMIRVQHPIGAGNKSCALFPPRLASRCAVRTEDQPDSSKAHITGLRYLDVLPTAEGDGKPEDGPFDFKLDLCPPTPHRRLPS
ncbi:hypothetical protein K402DRAFT_106993 [Aulographum hederae CBS 113979]|uniref:Uncharacterized protein n=1 Tax=Aulographum hederae CBS 113979 TaxID=1176131 RepID=A0A6G1GWN8_9PEZI|nr:hypothetical protein K402DRAFT_106993 [Aulographum hederae CBS 113979]